MEASLRHIYLVSIPVASNPNSVLQRMLHRPLPQDLRSNSGLGCLASFLYKKAGIGGVSSIANCTDTLFRIGFKIFSLISSMKMSLPNFNALRDLHNSPNDLLHSPELRRVLVNRKQEKWLEEVSEASLRMLEVCGISKDVLLLVKEHLLDLQLTLRRKRVSQPDIDKKIGAYNHYRKKLRKETLKCVRSLKGMESKSITSDISRIEDKMTVVVEVIREVRVTAITIVESFLSLISIPWLDQGSTKGSFIKSKFSRSMDDFCDETAFHCANKRLEAVEIAVEDLEVELECMFRRLIQTRVLLLNILTN